MGSASTEQRADAVSHRSQPNGQPVLCGTRRSSPDTVPPVGFNAVQLQPLRESRTVKCTDLWRYIPSTGWLHSCQSGPRREILIVQPTRKSGRCVQVVNTLWALMTPALSMRSYACSRSMTPGDAEPLRGRTQRTLDQPITRAAGRDTKPQGTPSASVPTCSRHRRSHVRKHTVLLPKSGC